MRRNLLDVLAGPPTGGPLTLVGDTGGEEIEEGELVSVSGCATPSFGESPGSSRSARTASRSASSGTAWPVCGSKKHDLEYGEIYRCERPDEPSTRSR